ncbi:hypothetical protein [Staphylococcus simulans]
MRFDMKLDGDFTMEELNEFWDYIIQREQEEKKEQEQNKKS